MRENTYKGLETDLNRTQPAAQAPLHVSDRLLSRKAAIPSLAVVRLGIRAQRDIVEVLRPRFAAGTVIEGLAALVGEGLVARSRSESSARGVEYECTRRGEEFAKVSVMDLYKQVVLDAAARRPSARGSPAGGDRESQETTADPGPKAGSTKTRAGLGSR